MRFSNDVLMLFSQTEEESKKKVVVAAVVTMGDSHHRSGGHLHHCIHSTAALSDGFLGTFFGTFGCSLIGLAP